MTADTSMVTVQTIDTISPGNEHFNLKSRRAKLLNQEGVVSLGIPADDTALAHAKRGPALAISKGIDRDRAVDESGNQLAVFGRRGARPLNLAESRRLYIHSRTGEPYTVSDTP
jgi:hypothetical protein